MLVLELMLALGLALAPTAAVLALLLFGCCCDVGEDVAARFYA